MKKIILVILFLLSFFQVNSLEACSICFYGDPNDPANIALKWSITALMLILFVVLALLAKFFLGVRKRAKLMEVPH